MGIKIELDYEVTDQVMEEGLKNSLDINAGIIVRLISELTEDSEKYKFEDLHDCMLMYADIYRSMQYYLVKKDAKKAALKTLRKNLNESV